MKSAMDYFFKSLLAFLFFGMASTAFAKPSTNIICSYAPSQSTLVASALGAAGSADFTIGAIATAVGLNVVKHSSGAYILSGSSGYIAGTIGGASVVPWIVGVSLVVGGATVVVEIVCANSNHPDVIRKLAMTAKEVSNKIDYTVNYSKAAANKLITKINPTANEASLKITKVTNEIWINLINSNVTFTNEFSGAIPKKYIRQRL